MESRDIEGGGGITIRVDETGNGHGPAVLFIHGLSQSRLSWEKQLTSDLTDDLHLLAMDIRGHGRSDKPTDAYDTPQLWADDIQGVIETFGLDQPILVGWSYGGVIIADYLHIYGERHIAGVNFVGAVSKLGDDDPAKQPVEAYTELVPGLKSTDVEESVEALQQFLRLCTYGTLSAHDLSYMLGFNVLVPPGVRSALLDRTVNRDDVLAELSIPVLITHGEEDALAPPAVAREHHELISNADLSWYSAVGHAPFWERPTRFNSELREFAHGITD